MGNQQSGIAAPHIRMYENLLGIQSVATRVQMIKTILSSPEHVQSAKASGIYGHLLHYVQVAQTGGVPPVLPGEVQRGGSQIVVRAGVGAGGQVQKKSQPTEKGNERAVNYFSACLRILELEEEVALTEESLKAAYKKAVVRAHPDKGGSEKEFEAVTRAYAYLGEILKRIHGGRAKEGKVEAPTALQGTRTTEEDRWKHVEPVALNPKNLDMNKFNQMFEQTRIPDPEEAGYGDWLKGGDDKIDAPKFSGKFNRDVFNKTFEEGAGANKPKKQYGAMVAQEQSLASRLGYATELGRTARDDYTVAPHDSKGLVFTDLKKAYTEYNTFSHETQDVKVTARSLDQYQAERERAPDPLADEEMSAMVQAEKAAARAEEQRKLRKAEEAMAEESYFKRMQRLVIRN